LSRKEDGSPPLPYERGLRAKRTMKIPKNKKVITCIVEKELWEYIVENYFERRHNDAEVLMKIIEYFVDMEEIREDFRRAKEAEIFRRY